MAKRLYMTTADYVTIALSPALVMTLVGSLVFFLIEVLYVGEYEARLMYVFALFVFSAVLIARIAIENGSEYASFFALPLGLATFFVLQRFVEHPSPFSWLINIGLMSVVWWSAHQLTWDCTLIDDSEDSSGAGLMQRIGVDEGDSTDNELLGGESDRRPWWRRLFMPKKGKHTPGLWVLYFSLAALPLFGVGQYWVPAADVGRRRYVFSLLLVYVSSALALLVTTSFLGLRRYLRQRRVEMPAPMAVNWVGIGAVLIVVVMLLAALIPRPYAEYAISQVPWQATSPGGLSSSRFSAGRDGSSESDPSGSAIKDDAPQGDAVRDDGTGEPAESDQGKPDGKPGGDQKSDGNSQRDKAEDGSQTDSGPQGNDGKQSSGESGENKDSNGRQPASREQEDRQENENTDGSRTANTPLPQHAADEKPFELPKISPPPLGMLAGALKLIFYAVLAILAAVFVWRNRQALARAIREILQQLHDFWAGLFGRRTAADEAAATAAQPAIRHRTFAEFRDPFASGDHRRMPPEELVRYTFEAFEAWARDAGHPRSPDQTPAELVRQAVEPQTPLDEQARRMTRLYSEVAYAGGRVTPAAADSLRELWSLLDANSRLPVAR